MPAFQSTLKTDKLDLQRQAYYNIGNTEFRVGQQTEKAKPEDTIKTWTDAVASYDASLKLQPADADAKFNRDLVQKKLDELKKQQQQKQDERKKTKINSRNKDQKDKDQQQNKDQKDKDQQQRTRIKKTKINSKTRIKKTKINSKTRIKKTKINSKDKDQKDNTINSKTRIKNKDQQTGPVLERSAVQRRSIERSEGS